MYMYVIWEGTIAPQPDGSSQQQQSYMALFVQL